MRRKDKKWWQHLLAIPTMLLIDIILLFGALMLDSKIFLSEGLGHGLPAVSLFAGMVLMVITVFIIVRAIVLAIRGIIF